MVGLTDKPKLSIFFPMFNEEENIHLAVGAAADACQDLLADGQISTYELLIVNDASTDSTAQLADTLAAHDDRIRVIHHPSNRKLGGSMKTGFANCTGDLVLYSDADLPFDMAEIAKALRVQRLYEADIVSAYRLDRTGEGYLRAIYTFFYNNLIRLFFGVRLRDVNFSFKLVRRELFDTITLQSEGSFIDAELLIRALRGGHRIIQFGTDYFPRVRGTSTLASPGVIVKILNEMWALRHELRAR